MDKQELNRSEAHFDFTYLVLICDYSIQLATT